MSIGPVEALDVAAMRPLRAAQYLRMSTDHQQYSTKNQASVIASYARVRRMDIVRTYSDEGLSGLAISWRPGLKSLIADVETSRADFECVLVYDVSRWGRFQDVDQSAYYEFICKRAGIVVHYCADEFENDGSFASSILKVNKRAAAADFSRSLSKKVFLGQSNVVQLGFWRGGMPGYGLRRQLYDPAGEIRMTLERGQRKYLQTDRVKIVHGPDNEVETVRRIFKAFVNEGQYLGEIASDLNSAQVRTGTGLRWDGTSIRKILVNEIYTGCLLFNRTSFKLQEKRVDNPASMWIRHDEAFPPIIDRSVFDKAQELLQVRREKMSNQEAIARLAALGREKGQLSAAILASADGCLSAESYRLRFGSLVAAFELAGYLPLVHRRRMITAEQFRTRLSKLADEIVERVTRLGGRAALDPSCKGVRIDEVCRIALASARALTAMSGATRWRIHANRRATAELTLVVRMDATNTMIGSYYLLPTAELFQRSRRFLRMSNPVFARACRYEDLDAFCQICAGASDGGAPQ